MTVLSNAKHDVKNLLVLVGLVCLATSLNLHATPQEITNKKTLQEAQKNAKSPEDYRRLAAYYRAKADKLRAQQGREEELATYYLVHAVSYPKKYPTPYDNTHHLAEYYRLAADDAQARAADNEKAAQKVAGEAKPQS